VAPPVRTNHSENDTCRIGTLMAAPPSIQFAFQLLMHNGLFESNPLGSRPSSTGNQRTV
jgi:hypothetical protein